MDQSFLIEGPFESDYSLAIVNRQLAYALLELGESIILHQRDNDTDYFPSQAFLSAHPRLASCFRHGIDEQRVAVHSRYIYPPFTDNMSGDLNVMHCYGWEESVFPDKYISDINRDIDLITVMSEYVARVLKTSGVEVPVTVVGLGADHVLTVPARAVALPTSEEFIFLHVSSCFPRKGCDVLLAAFCREFTKRDSVRLVIKTFPNPHNDIEKIIEENCRIWPDHAPISVIDAPLDAGQMRYLYKRAACLVSPSRGEGF